MQDRVVRRAAVAFVQDEQVRHVFRADFCEHAAGAIGEEERTAELSETNRELQQKNKENEMFVYSVSHDLRSPLVNLQGFGQELGLSCADLRALLLGDDVAEPVRDRGIALLNGPMAKSLRYVQSGVLRLSNIIDGMLRLSRTGRVIYRWQKVDIRTLVVRIVDALRGTAEQRGVAITIRRLEHDD